MKHFFVMVILLMAGLLQQVYAQNRALSGRVTDRGTGQGLPGATVLVKGTTIGASTNADGSFSLSVPPTATALTFSSIGYSSVDQPINDNATYDIALASDVKQLGEVVVTGALGIQRQSREIGYATATLDTREINQARVTNVTNGLAGKVSGLQIQSLSSGVNPSVRVTLRGTRSLTGNNQALIVLDGVIAPNDVLTALNPDDIASISVLKGANAAAIYGSQASNGALIVTTKRGGGPPQVTITQTSQVESLAFLPKFQTEFGPGANEYTTTLPKFDTTGEPDSEYHTQYQGFENQQFGPRFDGSLQPFGEALENGNIQRIIYEARPNEKRNFFNNAYQMQNNISFSAGDEKNKFYVSYQNIHNNGTVPKDKLDRNTVRLNASRQLSDRFNVGFNFSYSQKRVDYTSNADRDNSVYWNIFNTSVLAPITQYKDWRNDPYANPNGYYNAFYYNPYFIIDNNRTKNREDYVLGSMDLSYKLTNWLSLNGRVGTNYIAQSSLSTQNKFVYTPYVTTLNTNKSGAQVNGYVQDLSSNYNQLNTDVFASADKSFGDITVRALLGNNIQNYSSRYVYVNTNGLAVPDIFTVGNRVGEPTGSNARYLNRLVGTYGDVTVGYKEFLFLHGSGRYDQVSVLEKANRSFFYPGVDASIVFSEAIPVLKNSSFLDYGKIRGGITRVGQVNLTSTPFTAGTVTSVAQSNGAYQVQGTPYSQGAGFPFGAIGSFSFGNQIIAPGLKPEFVRSIETGIELAFLKRRVSTAVTYYTQTSTNQTLSAGVSRANGFSGLLLNAGEVQNNGVEADLNITPVRQENGLTFTVGGNFNYNNNKVVTITPDIHELALTTGGNANVFAIEGQPFPVLKGSYYERDDAGRVKMLKAVDPETNATIYFPKKASDDKILGNTLPKYRYGFNSSISYRGLTLAGQAELRTGYVVYHTIGENLDFTGGSQRSVQYGRESFVYPNSSILGPDGVTYIPNTAGLTPGGSEFWSSAAYNTSVAENYVTTGKFFKIREVSLSYALPTTLVQSIGFIKGASLNLYARNIFTWVPKENQYTDPEFSFGNSTSNAVGINTVNQTPPTKFLGASLSATF